MSFAINPGPATQAWHLEDLENWERHCQCILWISHTGRCFCAPRNPALITLLRLRGMDGSTSLKVRSKAHLPLQKWQVSSRYPKTDDTLVSACHFFPLQFADFRWGRLQFAVLLQRPDRNDHKMSVSTFNYHFYLWPVRWQQQGSTSKSWRKENQFSQLQNVLGWLAN